MNKLALFCLLFSFSMSTAFASLETNKINTFNLKESSKYIFDLDAKAEDISVSDKNILSILPMTSLLDDRKQLFIDVFKSGVCDVVIKTAENIYNVRFISGKYFEESDEILTKLDLPTVFEKN